MPNWVKNRLVIIGSEADVTAIVEALKGKPNEMGICDSIDFNGVVEMPEELLNVTSPVTIVSQAEYLKELAEINTELLRQANGEKSQDYFRTCPRGITKKMSDLLIKKYGTNDWYDWACHNWGTKWNACRPEPVEMGTDGNDTTATIEFETAWTTPYAFISRLTKKYPDVTVNVQYADEDAGQNVGFYFMANGVDIENNGPEPGSNEAMEMYFDLWGGGDEWEKDENGEYQYVVPDDPLFPKEE